VPVEAVKFGDNELALDPPWDIIDYIKELLERLTRGIQSIIDTITGRVGGALDTLGGFLREIRDRLSSEIGKIVDKIESAATTIATKITDKIGEFIDTITGAIDYFIGKLHEFMSSLAAAITSVINGIKEKLGDIIGTIRDAIGNAIERITDWIGRLWERLKETYETIRDAITGAIRHAVQAVGEWIRDAWERITTAVRTAYERIRETTERIYRQVSEFITTWVRRIWNWLQDIWEKIETNVRQALLRFFMFLRDAWGRATEAAQAIWKLGEIVWNAVVTGDYEKAFGIVDAFFRGIGLPAPVRMIRSFVSAVAYFWLTVELQFIPLRMQAELNAIKMIRPSGLDLQTCALAVHLGYIGEGEFYESAARLGIPNEIARAAFATLRRFPTPGELISAWLRGIIDEGTLNSMLGLLGYDGRGIGILKSLAWVMPSPSDLIRMAVREVFSPEIVEKFGMMEDFPPEFAELARKIGISEEVAKWYWAAHWDLPSATMGFEMFHRGIIDEEELKLLLRALDVMPFWRDKLIQLSYNVVTRVDARRLYKLGVWDEERLYKEYLAMGYRPEDARALVEFTKQYYSPEDETELDRYFEAFQKLVIKAYKKGNITRDEAKAYLLESRTTEEKAELLLSLADAEIALLGGEEEVIPLRTRTINIVLDAYKRGVITASEVKEYLSLLNVPENEQEWYLRLSEFEVMADDMVTLLEIAHRKYAERTWTREEAATFLSQIGLTGQKIHELLNRWEIDRLATFRKPTEAQFRAALKKGLISIEEYKEELRGLGYDEKYVELLAKLATGGGE